MRNNFRAGARVLALAALIFILPGCKNGQPSASPAPSPSPGSSPRHHAAAQEARYKEQAVQRDMAATERLGKMQSVRDAKRFMKLTTVEALDRDPGPALRRFLQEHPEIAAASWVSGDGRAVRTEGEAGSNSSETAFSKFKQAREAVGKGAAYTSSVFTQNGRKFFVLGEPAQTHVGKGLIAIVSAEVVHEVERHQRRNLRLIPYPAEGRYRIESVKPNTTQDITVRKGEDNGNASHYAVDEVVVKFRKPLTARELLKLRRELDLTVVRHSKQTYVFRSGTHRTESLLTYFKRMNPVYIEPHYLYLTNDLLSDSDGEAQVIVPNDTLYAEYQWNLPQIETEQGWNWNKGSRDMVVAVIDTGVQADHPDLKGRLVKGVNIVDPSASPEDDVGHGTHVAGIIAAQVNNNEGVAGLTWFTKIMPVKALDNTGAGSTYSVAEGVIWAADHGANIINMSLGNYAEAQFLHDAIQYAADKGVLVVAASGNDNTDRPGYPAAYPEVLAVAATDPGGAKAEYSNYGDYIDVAAPGTSIASTYPGSRYAALSGTSMAAPHASALASLIRAANPGLSNAEVMDLLRNTAQDLGDQGKDPYFGYGQIDIRKALQAASGQASSLQLFLGQVRKRLEQVSAP